MGVRLFAFGSGQRCFQNKRFLRREVGVEIIWRSNWPLRGTGRGTLDSLVLVRVPSFTLIGTVGFL